MSIQRGTKLSRALPMRTEYKATLNLKKHGVNVCPNHAKSYYVLKRIKELKSIQRIISVRSETDDG